MSEVKWTKEQLQAIVEDGSNILVAAAAGSGKTAVLVERIINKIINEKIDIDKILIVTFTNAAASEMRQRILEAIYRKLDENPENNHLQKQVTLLTKASICTIHSFCLDVIRNNFYEIDISPNFRIADTAELELLKQEVIENIFEEKYINNDEKFLKLVYTYTGYRGDEPLKELVLKIYKYIQSSPFPEKWLRESVEKYNLKEKLEQDFSKTEWGQILINSFKDELKEDICILENLYTKLIRFDELVKFSNTIRSDIDELKKLNALDLWDEIAKELEQFKFEKWPIDKKIVLDLKDIARETRDKVKNKFNKVKEKMMLSSKEINEDIYSMYSILKNLENLILDFTNNFSKEKRERNIIDFNDIEHFALKILLKEDEAGNYIPSDIAEKYKNKFVQIAIDEYQDSNLVQEYILNTISKNNIFMVGDVKQSIYKFRQARPELFLEKYEKYKLKEDMSENDKASLKIQLFKNFRSRKNILDVTNLVFENIMSKELGDIQYNENEYLNLGAQYEKTNIGISELCIINTKKNEDEEKEDSSEEDIEDIEDIVLEAKFVANKIKEIMEKGYLIYDKKIGLRKVTYKDIVILLRATNNRANIFEKEISDLGFPIFSDTSAQYLDSIEIQTIMSLLKIIDNPMQDIPLVTVLKSMIGGFTDNELIKIRINSMQGSFYDAMIKYTKEDNELSEKISKFFNTLSEWRKEQEYLSLDELIWKIYIDTNYYNYVSLMQNGGLRQANLKLLFEKARQYEQANFKGLFNFINFIDKLKVNNGDLNSAKIIGENEDVIRIMSIHKSKGLEFPIVFLSGCGKRFNMQDLNSNILLHQDIGIGVNYIDYERKIEYPTLTKEAIKNKITSETISEEMRILYVALTRAKEKLYITGIKKDAEKSIKEKSEMLEIYSNKKIDKNVVKKYKTYLDWLELVYLNNKDKIEDILKLNIYNKEDFIKNLNKENENQNEDTFSKIIEKTNNIQTDKKLEDILNWKYGYEDASKINAKTSVTSLKQTDINSDEVITPILNVPQRVKLETPKFLKKEEKITGAQKGTLIHLCMQKLDLNIDYTLEKIDKLLDNMVKKELITPIEKESIDIQKIYKFTESVIWKDMKMAKKVYREKPFYIYIPSDEIYDTDVKEQILVQGIIDLYYINQNDEVILVDYKSDYVKTEMELIEKYKKQLEIYKVALEESLNKKVSKVYIYSTFLDRIIEIN